MATFKHISSKNANYGDAEKYLTFAHNEFTMKPTLDENGRLVPREDYRISTMNCGEEDFAIACMRSNLRYGKNQKREDVKSHHYIITYVLCYELISMVTEKNNMHDVDTSMFFKWVFKAFVAVYLVTHTFDITMAVFDMAQHVVSGAAGVIGGSTEIDVAAALASMQDGLDAMEIPELLLLVMETSLVSLCMKIMSVLITVILYGRMIEIYLYCSVSPIPFATMTNREWGQIGNNYLKSLFAIGFQGFLIMICVGIYAVLVNNMIIADNLHSAIFSLAAYTVILCFSLFKSGALAKSIFSAH